MLATARGGISIQAYLTGLVMSTDQAQATDHRDTENARSTLEQELATARAGPAGSVLRKVVSFWSTRPDAQIKANNSAQIGAAVTRAMRESLTAAIFPSAQAVSVRRVVLRTKEKAVTGKPLGLF